MPYVHIIVTNFLQNLQTFFRFFIDNFFDWVYNTITVERKGRILPPRKMRLNRASNRCRCSRSVLLQLKVAQAPRQASPRTTCPGKRMHVFAHAYITKFGRNERILVVHINAFKPEVCFYMFRDTSGCSADKRTPGKSTVSVSGQNIPNIGVFCSDFFVA